MITRLLLCTVLCLLAQQTHAFVCRPKVPGYADQPQRGTTTSLHMVFDFFKQKSKEGFNQLNTLADATYKGNLGKGLIDVAAYTKASNEAFATGLAKSRVRLQEGLETLFTGMSPEQALEELEDILLQSDLGIDVAEAVVEEVRALRADSTKMLSRDDLRSILRGKLIEALDTGKSEVIQFSSSGDLPTVLFVMGANGMGVSFTAKFVFKKKIDLCY